MTDTQQKSNEVSDIELFKSYWYKRNPCHETNFDSGEDLFWGTAELVAREYVADLQLRSTTSEPIKDATCDLLSDIISWEKDLSEYMSLESILKEKYKITKR